MRKKIPKGSFLLFVSFAAISMCLLLVLSAARAGRVEALCKNGLYSGRQRSFGISGAEGEGQWEEIIPALANQFDGFAIFLPIKDSEVLMKGMFLKGEVEAPPMIWGSYFDSQTSWAERPTAVIGKNCRDDAVWREGKLYYACQGVEYEVIGIMGAREESRLDQMVAVDFRSAVRTMGVNASYVLDAEKESDIIAIGKEIERLLAPSAELGMFLGEREKGSLLDSIFSGGMIMNAVYAMALASFFLSAILVSLIWLRFRRPLFFAWELCGYGRGMEWAETAKRFAAGAAAGIAAGQLVVLGVSFAMPDISVAVLDILKASGMSIGLGSIIFLACACSAKCGNGGH